YVHGETLVNLIRRSAALARPIDYSLCAFIVAEVCAGLHTAHELTDEQGERLNVVHRDVSPQNVCVTYEGAVKVLDFGIAKATDRITKTETGTVKGKFPYMSPEHCLGHWLDRRSDVFSLAVVLYELSTRHRLFKRGSEPATIRAVLEEPILPP